MDIDTSRLRSDNGFTPLETSSRPLPALIRLIEAKTICSLKKVCNLRKRFCEFKKQKRFLSLTGFTLVELIIVVIIIGVLAGLSLPIFNAAKEKSLDKEAKTALTLVYSANKVYHSQSDNFYPPAGSGGYAAINQNLNLDLSGTNWSYSISGASGAYTATATRSGRTWTVNQNSPVPTCSGSCLP